MTTQVINRNSNIPSGSVLAVIAKPGGFFRNIDRKRIYNSKIRVYENNTFSQVNKLIDNIIINSLLKKD